MKPPYDIFADRWGSHSFTDYVNKLEQQADQALESARSVSDELPMLDHEPVASRTCHLLQRACAPQ